jgi:archaellum component FlaF (FlaF/FlaG flagellin family)
MNAVILVMLCLALTGCVENEDKSEMLPEFTPEFNVTDVKILNDEIVVEFETNLDEVTFTVLSLDDDEVLDEVVIPGNESIVHLLKPSGGFMVVAYSDEYGTLWKKEFKSLVKLFSVEGVEVVDDKGSPAVRVKFETDKYPIEFVLMTSDGEILDTYVAEFPERVAKLKIYYEHVNLEIHAYHDNVELWNTSLRLKGIEPLIRIKNVSFDVLDSLLYVESLVFDVTNTGDVPLYINTQTLEVYFDDAKYYITEGNILTLPSNTTIDVYDVVMPNETKSFKLVGLCSIRSNLLSKNHTLRVVICKEASDKYEIPALNPIIRIESIGIDRYGYLDNITLNITNNWIAPISTDWIDVYVNGDYEFFETSTKFIVGTQTVILDVDVRVEKGDRLTIKLGKAEVAKVIESKS